MNSACVFFPDTLALANRNRAPRSPAMHCGPPPHASSIYLEEAALPGKSPQQLLEANAQWSEQRVAADADYFRRLVALQEPEFLWIGCSDSRVPANVITGLEPGEVFVHRNVANLVYPTDPNCMTVLEFAVETLHVKHIIVCGHYGCNGLRAVFERTQHGFAQHWLGSIDELYRQHEKELSRLPSDEDRLDRLCELNVIAQVRSVCDSPIVRRAWERGKFPTVHGWIYRLTDGRLHDLKCSPTI
jgi:carbonic anhydrase